VGVKLEQLSAAIGKSAEIAEKLDQILAGPNDRAFLVCEYDDCKFNLKGRCSIYAVQDVPRMKTKAACSSYETRSQP
jgi:hypothetical protein